MSENIFGRILGGDEGQLKRSFDAFSVQEVDQDLSHTTPAPIKKSQTTINEPVVVSGPGTFLGSATRTLRLEPTTMPGWWFDRSDIPECLPVRVSIRNVWTTGNIVSNIVLRSGPPQNYIRLVEHIIALRAGMDIDNLMIRIDSGDPPLFDRGSLDIVEALERAGRREYQHPVKYVTVKEKVTLAGHNGQFLIFEPVDKDRLAMDLDCAIDFKTAIGRQRIKYPVNMEHFCYGAEARTNTSNVKKLYCQTMGRMFADIRNLGYTDKNVLVAGKFGYANEPKLMQGDKSLEASWHRATLDLLAAIALIEEGRFLGKITSYKAGHGLDVEMVRQLYKHNLLETVEMGEQ